MSRPRLLITWLVAAPLPALAASIPLYPTGPSEDSAFLRFVSAAPGTLELVAAGSGASLALEGDSAASDFLVVPAGKPVQGTLTRGEKQQALDVTVEPGEFVTVVGLAGQGQCSASAAADARSSGVAMGGGRRCFGSEYGGPAALL